MVVGFVTDRELTLKCSRKVWMDDYFRLLYAETGNRPLTGWRLRSGAGTWTGEESSIPLANRSGRVIGAISQSDGDR